MMPVVIVMPMVIMVNVFMHYASTGGPDKQEG